MYRFCQLQAIIIIIIMIIIRENSEFNNY